MIKEKLLKNIFLFLLFVSNVALVQTETIDFSTYKYVYAQILPGFPAKGTYSVVNYANGSSKHYITPFNIMLCASMA